MIGDQTSSNERFNRGPAKLREIDDDAGTRVIEALRDVAPDLGRYTIEFPFGDIYTHPGLDLRDFPRSATRRRS